MKKIFSLILLSLITILMAGIVNGADPTCTFDQTATTIGTESTYIKGTDVNLSVTITNAGETTGDNATMGIITVSSGTISGALIFNTSDGTNNTYINTTIDTLALPDDTSHIFTMTMYNESQDVIGTACTRTFITDNTIPVLTLQTPADLAKNKTGTILFSYSCVNASSGILYLENRPHTMTESSDVCSITIKYLTNGFQSWYITASDGLNITTSSTTQVQIAKPGGMLLDARGQLIQPGTAAAAVPTGNVLQRMVNVIRQMLASILSMFQRG